MFQKIFFNIAYNIQEQKKKKKKRRFLSNSFQFRSFYRYLRKREKERKYLDDPSIIRKKNDLIQRYDKENSLIWNCQRWIWNPIKFGEEGKTKYVVGLLICSNRHLESLPSHGTKRFPFSLDCETIFYRGALALRIYYICNGLRKLRQSANISHDLHLHDSPFYARSFKPSGHVNCNQQSSRTMNLYKSFFVFTL